MKWLELKVPPPFVTALSGLLMYGLSLMPSLGLLFAAPLWLVLMQAVGGLGIGVWSAWIFHRVKTTPNPRKPAHACQLVVVGPYRLSRNPMYVGLCLMLSGWATYLGNPVTYLVIPLFGLYLTRFQIIPEERAMLKNFGDSYSTYYSQVRRWL